MSASFTITEAKNKDNILLGLGRLGIAAVPVTSPVTFTDVGYIKGAGFNYTREIKDFESGGILVKRSVIRDRFTLKADLAEFSIDQLNRFIQGTKTGSDTLTFGGHRTRNTFYVRFEHLRTDNAIVQLDIYQALPAGSFDLAFQEEDYMVTSVEFGAEASSSYASGQQYGRIRILT